MEFKLVAVFLVGAGCQADQTYIFLARVRFATAQLAVPIIALLAAVR